MREGRADAVCDITAVQVESVRDALEGFRGYIVACTDFLVCHGVLAIIECTHTDRSITAPGSASSASSIHSTASNASCET